MRKELKILVVVDNSDLLKCCKQSLEDQYKSVHYAHSGESAFELLKRHDFNVVLISSVLTDITGVQFFIKAKNHFPHLCGLLLTDHNDQSNWIQAYNNGLYGIIKTPINASSLKEKIAFAAANAQILEENTRLNTLLPLYQLSEGFLRAKTKADVFETLFDTIETVIGGTSVTVMMKDDDSNLLKIIASRNMDHDLASQIRLKPGSKIAGWVFQSGQPVILNKRTQEKSQFAHYLKKKDITASISFPLRDENEVIGVINISHTKEEVEFREFDLEIVTIAAAMTNMALENINYHEQKTINVRLRTMMEQYVAPEIAEDLLSQKNDPLYLGGVEELTVLFADIRNFTLLVQNLNLADMRSFLNSFFDQFTETIYNHNGMLDKYMGDAVLAIFGSPRKLENQGLPATSAAVEIINNFNKLKQKWANIFPFFHQIELGIGISKGEMFIGNVGSSRRLDYTVIGTDVNIAQRLASETAGGDILLTNSVKQDIEASFICKEQPKKKLRGLLKEIQIYAVDVQIK